MLCYSFTSMLLNTGLRKWGIGGSRLVSAVVRDFDIH